MNLNQYSISAAQPGLAVDRIAALDIPTPPINEQNKIAKYIKEENIRFNSVCNKIQKEIDLLQEYRAALISEVVTGKIDVREEVGSWT
jgi:type I restriction enzyme, S subunit